MGQKKTLQSLTIKNNFMFGTVMSFPEICRPFLEMTLGFQIQHLEVSMEKSLVYHPEYKGVRLDIYAKDGKNTHYNVEMQVAAKPCLGKRVRYYHSQIDMELLQKSTDYSELPSSYVIFICDFDPFGAGKYRYIFENRCRETGEAIGDGNVSIFLSTCGKDESQVPAELVRFLQFVKADLDESVQDFHDNFIKKVQDCITEIKANRKVEERFMLLEEMLKEERMEGKAEGKAEFLMKLLGTKGELPDDLYRQILGEQETSRLDEYFKIAVNSKSIEDFMSQIR